MVHYLAYNIVATVELDILKLSFSQLFYHISYIYCALLKICNDESNLGFSEMFFLVTSRFCSIVRKIAHNKKLLFSDIKYPTLQHFPFFNTFFH